MKAPTSAVSRGITSRLQGRKHHRHERDGDGIRVDDEHECGPRHGQAPSSPVGRMKRDHRVHDEERDLDDLERDAKRWHGK